MGGDYDLVDSFHIDDGELDGLTPQMCFVLGVEWQNVVSAVDRYDKELKFTVHAENKERLDRSIEKRGRLCVWVWPEDDRSESWVFLTIEGMDTENESEEF